MPSIEELSIYAQAIGVNMTPLHSTPQAIGDALPESDQLFISEHWRDVYKFARTERGQRDPLIAQSVRLTLWHVRAARRIGGGNVSDGIRLAIERVAQAGEQWLEQPKRATGLVTNL